MNENGCSSLEEFCRQLINHSQWKRMRYFYCGSSMEIPAAKASAKLCRVSNSQLDRDQMVYNTTRYAFPRNFPVPERYSVRGSVIRIYTEEIGLHVGYARLIYESNNLEPERGITHECKEGDSEIMHGPAVQHNARLMLQMETYSLSNIDFDHKYFETNDIYTYDVTVAIHSPCWPLEAAEWLTRKRAHGVPSMSIIGNVVGYGCDFVQVAHKLSDNSNEWRFSFSKAELLIVKGWTVSQRIVYETLWVINKKIDSRYLCTYYFKTLMFWACEEKSAQFWQDNLLLYSVRELLLEMINCLTLKFCENYFIRGNNMMDHLIDVDLSDEFGYLQEAANATEFILDVMDIFRDYELTFFHCKCFYESPGWIKRALLIHHQLDYIFDNFKNLFKINYSSKDLQNAVYVEFSDIYEGLRLQKEALNCVNDIDQCMLVVKCENHLTRAMKLCESFDQETIDNCSEEFLHSIGWFMSYDPDKSRAPSRPNSITEFDIKREPSVGSCSLTREIKQIKHKSLLYSRSSEGMKNDVTKSIGGSRDGIYHCQQINIVSYRVRERSGNEVRRSKISEDDCVHFYKEWPGRSPTVNISWFIAKAYLANLYYRTQRDTSLIMNTCDDIIDVYKLSHVNKEFAERTFPVILSTQWTSIYDNEIQELLGFYLLSSFVINKSKGHSEVSVYLGVCPVQFALYVKVRTSTRSYKDSCELTTINKYVNDYIGHNKTCEFDPKTNNGELAITAVLCASINRYFQNWGVSARYHKQYFNYHCI